MPEEPLIKRAVAFFDGQNLFHSAKTAFGYSFPNYDPVALTDAICAAKGWKNVGVRFYTGIPSASDNSFWNHFWMAKGAQLGREGVNVFTRALRYRNKSVKLPDGNTHTYLDGDEKGIDVRLALDVVGQANSNSLDVALIFSRDQDLSEVADEIREIAQLQRRWIKVASAYPCSPAVPHFKGVQKTDWVRIDRVTYDNCIDTRDYRPKLAPLQVQTSNPSTDMSDPAT